MRDEGLYQRACNELILREGFPTYGGMAGGDLEAIVVGLWESPDETHLAYRVRQTAYLADRLLHGEIPIIQPPGATPSTSTPAPSCPTSRAKPFPG
jgi:tryptophanase